MQAQFQALFVELDADNSGFLDPSEMAGLLRRLAATALPDRALRRLVINIMRSVDTSGEGQVSYAELLHGLRAVNVRIQGTNHLIPAGTWPAM